MNRSSFVRHDFNAASDDEMVVFGKSLAGVLDLSNRVTEEKHRLGLMGDPNAGKTLLSDALLSTDDSFVKFHTTEKGQFSGHSNSLGHVFRHDARYSEEELCGDPSTDGDMRTEILEHPEKDRGLFHLVVGIEPPDLKGSRLLIVFTDKALGETAGFQGFLGQATHLRCGL